MRLVMSVYGLQELRHEEVRQREAEARARAEQEALNDLLEVDFHVLWSPLMWSW